MKMKATLTMPELNKGLDTTSLLDDLASWPLLKVEELREFNSVLVIAPHPDDESLGCGGLIANLGKWGSQVRVLFVSDGKASHPNSRKYPPAALKALRQQEALAALAELGVRAEAAKFLEWPDTAVPNLHQAGFEQAVTNCYQEIEQFQIKLVVAPWRRDPHVDHRASCQIARTALERTKRFIRLLEYPIWIWDLAQAGDAPRREEARGWRLDIEQELAQKQAAVAAHRSQTTDLIDDDPEGFRLDAGMLARFAQPWEYFLESYQL